MNDADAAFADRYGPWALVLGASDGVGAEYARAMARRGLNVALLARRQGALDEVAAGIRTETGVETLTVTVDLAEHDAITNIAKATDGLEIGMVMYCAGADATYQPFLANPIEVPLALVHRNCVVPMQVCHHFAGPMQARGKGALVVVSSAGGFIGGPNMVAYGASKAFDIVMAEALWTELHDKGVDVLSLVLGPTDTPALRRLLVSRGVLADESTPVPNSATPEQVVAEAIANLANGPSWVVGKRLRLMIRLLGVIGRRQGVKTAMRRTDSIMSITHGRAKNVTSGN